MIIAPAKLNLFLHITGKRPGGFHLLESLTVFTEFGDGLEIHPAPGVSLNITGPFASSLEGSNLVLRAAELLQPHAKGQGANITLHKHIPVGAGLGGGSADAAATLRALHAFWDLNLTGRELHAMALQLGSDVPACLLDASGWVTGTGDTVTPIAIPHGGWVVLANPRTPLLTAHVFRACSGNFTPSIPQPHTLATTASLAAWAALQHNDLEAPAISLLPGIAYMLKAISQTESCLLSRMSGSGATCFGLYETKTHAHAAATQLHAAHPDWWVQATALKGTPHGQAQ